MVFGASLLLFGGRGRTCHSDVAIFHLAAEARTGNLLSAAVQETPGGWEHPHCESTPTRRQGHALVALGSRRMLTLGGFCTDDATYASPEPLAASFSPHERGMMLAVEAISPTAAGVGGGVTLALHGKGFQPGARHRVRFAVRAAHDSRAPRS